MTKLFLDIGGTHLRSVLEGEGGIVEESVDSPKEGLLAYLEKKISRHPGIGFIGIAYAGQVSGGRILSAPNLNVDESAIAERIAERYGIEVAIDNDLNCAALAEVLYWGVGNIALLYVGTGIGAAVTERGNLVRGWRNLSFEIGHIPYREAPFACGCGRTNCVELYASGSGMAKWLAHRGSFETPNLQRLKSSPDQRERGIAEGFEEALLYAAGTLVTLANPELLVLGGGVVQENPALAETLRGRLEKYALGASLEGLRIEVSRLENAPLQGAKLLEGLKNG